MVKQFILTLFLLALLISVASAGGVSKARPSSAGSKPSSGSSPIQRNNVPRIAPTAKGPPPPSANQGQSGKRPSSAPTSTTKQGKSAQRGNSNRERREDEEDQQGTAPSSSSSSSSSTSNENGGSRESGSSKVSNAGNSPSSAGKSSQKGNQGNVPRAPPVNNGQQGNQGNVPSHAGTSPERESENNGSSKLRRSSSSSSKSEQGNVPSTPPPTSPTTPPSPVSPTSAGSAPSTPSTPSSPVSPTAAKNGKQGRQAAINLRSVMRMGVRAERREGRGNSGVVPSATAEATEPGNVLSTPEEEIGELRDERRKVRLIKRFDRQLRRKKGSKESISPSQLRREKHRLAREQNRLQREEERDVRVGVQPATLETIKNKARSVVEKRKKQGRNGSRKGRKGYSVKHRRGGNIEITIHLK